MHAATSTPQVSEAQRFERLRAQDGKPLLPPPSVHSLLGQGGLDPAKAPQAVQMWQAAQQELSAAHSFPAEERVFWCFFLLAALYSTQGDRHGAAKIARETLPYVQDPRHQQLVLGAMARYSALTRDTKTATESAARLDPRSEDLLVDSTYRLTTAYMAALNGDDATVLSVLGSNTTDIPICDAYDELCGVLRANAHERQGRGDMAAQQLTATASSQKGLAALQKIVQMNHELQLLGQTLPKLVQMGQQIQANVVQTKSGVNVGAMFMLPVVGIAIFGGGGALMSSMSPQVQTIATIAGTVGFIALTFVFVARVLLRGPAQRKRLQRTGVDGIGKIVAVETTGTRVNHQPMFRLRMLIELPSQTPYMALHNEIMAPGRAQQLPPGTQLRVKVDRDDPRVMAIVWGGG